MESDKNITTEEVALEDRQIICALTNDIKTNKGKEPTLQSLILMLNEEYRFDLADMERDYTLSYEDKDDAKKKRLKIDLVVFETDKPHEADSIIRICVVQDDKTKAKDLKKGVEATLEKTLEYLPNCEFGVWTNGDVFHFLQKECDRYDNLIYSDISDFPGLGQTMDDLERSDKISPRKPANDSLVRTFKRCHDYIYANEGMKKTAFWELLNLIFCKIYDEKRRFMPLDDEKSYRRHFWVGVKEQNSEKGLKAIAERIKGIFMKLKSDNLFSEVFDGNEQIGLSDRGLGRVSII